MKRIENKENSPISEVGNPELTEREMEVLELAGHGFSQKEIAEKAVPFYKDGRQAYREYQEEV